MFSILLLLVFFRVLEHDDDVMSMRLNSFIYNTNRCRHWSSVGDEVTVGWGRGAGRWYNDIAVICETVL